MELNERFLTRFWAKITKSDGTSCWLWNASRTNFGYGQFMVSSMHRPVGAHRISWIIANGPIPHGQHVLHKCDNPPCVNPAHLFLGSHLDNVKDMRAKGRGDGPKGVNHPHAVFDEKDIKAIKALIVSESLSLRRIAKMFNVSHTAIIRIKNQVTWRGVLRE